jgi:hypothetical protein
MLRSVNVKLLSMRQHGVDHFEQLVGSGHDGAPVTNSGLVGWWPLDEMQMIIPVIITMVHLRI